MFTVILALLILAIIAIAITIIAKKSNTDKTSPSKLTPLSELNNLTKREPLTPREQDMYLKLMTAAPNHIVLAQVAFSALVTTTSKTTRNRFDKKVADFVLCDNKFKVLAVIELDDTSHKGKEHDDVQRDAMLKNAGYKTLRYRNIPETSTLRTDLTKSGS